MYLDFTQATPGVASDKFSLDGDNMKAGKTARAGIAVLSGTFVIRQYSPDQGTVLGSLDLDGLHVLEVPVAGWYDVQCVTAGRVVVQQ